MPLQLLEFTDLPLLFAIPGECHYNFIFVGKYAITYPFDMFLKNFGPKYPCLPPPTPPPPEHLAAAAPCTSVPFLPLSLVRVLFSSPYLRSWAHAGRSVPLPPLPPSRLPRARDREEKEDDSRAPLLPGSSASAQQEPQPGAGAQGPRRARRRR